MESLLAYAPHGEVQTREGFIVARVTSLGGEMGINMLD